MSDDTTDTQELTFKTGNLLLHEQKAELVRLMGVKTAEISEINMQCKRRLPDNRFAALQIRKTTLLAEVERLRYQISDIKAKLREESDREHKGSRREARLELERQLGQARAHRRTLYAWVTGVTPVDEALRVRIGNSIIADDMAEM